MSAVVLKAEMKNIFILRWGPLMTSYEILYFWNYVKNKWIWLSAESCHRDSPETAALSQTFTYLINTVVSFFQCLSDYTGLSKFFAWQVFNLYFTLLEDMSTLKRSLNNLLRLKINRYADSANLHRFPMPLLIFSFELMSPLSQKNPYIAILISAVPDHVQGPSFYPNQQYTVLLRF